MSMHGADAAPRFALGRIVMTDGARETLTETEVIFALRRHGEGDWGDLDPSDRAQNERAVTQGGRIVSIYEPRPGGRFYVITEPDRSLTTVLLPAEY